MWRGVGNEGCSRVDDGRKDGLARRGDGRVRRVRVSLVLFVRQRLFDEPRLRVELPSRWSERGEAQRRGGHSRRSKLHAITPRCEERSGPQVRQKRHEGRRGPGPGSATWRVSSGPVDAACLGEKKSAPEASSGERSHEIRVG